MTDKDLYRTEREPAATDGITDREARLLADHGGRRWPYVVLGVILVLGLALGAGWLWLQRQIDPPGEPGDEIAVTIEEGSSASEIADHLASEGIVTSGTVFEYYARFKGAGSWQAGVYQLAPDSAMDDVIDRLDAGPAAAPFAQVTIPEGFTVYESAGSQRAGSAITRIADPDQGVGRFSQRRLMDVVRSGNLRSRYQPSGVNRLEGLLFPDTYSIEDDVSEEQALTMMVQRFDEVAAEVGLDDATTRIRAATDGQVDLTPFEAIIVASLIERETKVAEERPMVARVIYNRLAVSNPLGIDATTVYALGRPVETESDVRFDSPYNTRINAGLPPGPIGLPGRAALEAALNPAEGDWFYYVLADQDGRHAFSETAAQFEADKARCQDLGLC